MNTFTFFKKKLIFCLLFLTTTTVSLAQIQSVVPNFLETQSLGTDATFFVSSRTYQFLIDESQLTNFVGMELNGISFRIPSGASSWPVNTITYTNFDIYIGESVPLANNGGVGTPLADNFLTPKTLVRSGSLVIPSNSYGTGNPAPFGPTITFDTPYLYTSGNLLIETRNLGGNASNERMDVLSNSHPSHGINGGNTVTVNIGVNYSQTNNAISGYHAPIMRISANPPPCTTVNIPDANFKNALLTYNPAIDTNADGEIQCTEAEAVTGTLNVSNKNIADLTGIEAFINITELRCNQNQLTSLNISSNVNLTELRCNQNQLTSLNISSNVNLANLRCHQNQLGSLDVSANVNLVNLYCQENQLTTIDISNNIALVQLWCYDNQLTSINTGNITTLERLLCYTNQLQTLDISGNTGLLRLEADDNQFVSLDVSNNHSLNRLECRNNQLTTLNVKNTNNLNFVTFEAENNPLLNCVQVDDAVWSAINWGSKVDEGVSFSEDCFVPCVVNIPDANFKNYLLNNSAINTNNDGEIQCSEAQDFIGNIDCNINGISDLTGIEAFVNITKLSCFGNLLTTLDLTNNTNLTEVYCNNNQLLSLDVSNLTYLTRIEAQGNQLTSTNLNINNTPALYWFEVDHNQLTTLDVTNNTNLFMFLCQENNLTALDVSNNNFLNELNCSNNQLTSLNVKNENNSYIASFQAKNNPYLFCIQVDNVANSTVSWSDFIDNHASFAENCSVCSDAVISAINTTQTTANIFWTIGDWETSWNIEYGLENYTQGSNQKLGEATKTVTNHAFANLAAGTTYDFYIQSDCGNGILGNWTKHSFTTNCADVSEISVSNITTTQATISWTTENSEAWWNIEYGTQGFLQGTGTTLNITTNLHTITGLTPNTTYDLYVQADCGSGNQSGWGTISFSTEEVISRADFIQNTIKLFPNPTSDFVIISSSEILIQNLKVYDIKGSLLYENQINTTNVNLDLSKFNKGIYFVKITSENGQITRKVVKN